MQKQCNRWLGPIQRWDFAKIKQNMILFFRSHYNAALVGFFVCKNKIKLCLTLRALKQRLHAGAPVVKHFCVDRSK